MGWPGSGSVQSLVFVGLSMFPFSASREATWQQLAFAEESLCNTRRSEHSPYLGNWGKLTERRLSDWRAGHPPVRFMRILRPGEVRSLVRSSLAGQLWLN